MTSMNAKTVTSKSIKYLQNCSNFKAIIFTLSTVHREPVCREVTYLYDESLSMLSVPGSGGQSVDWLNIGVADRLIN